MKNRNEELKTEFKAIEKVKIFEIEVKNQEGAKDWIIFDISINGETFQAQHIGLTQEEEESKKIAFKSVDIDDCFTIDEHLQDLYEECTTAIMNSEFYTLND